MLKELKWKCWGIIFRRALKIARSIISFVMPVCPSFRPHGTTQLPLYGFLWNLILKYFSKICWENSSPIDMWLKWFDALHEQLRTFITISRWILLRLINVSKKFVAKIKTHISSSITIFWKSYRLWDSVEKYRRGRQATDDNIIWRKRFACWITKATDTHRIRNIYCPFTSTIITRKHLSVTCIFTFGIKSTLICSKMQLSCLN